MGLLETSRVAALFEVASDAFTREGEISTGDIEGFSLIAIES